jgi:hypothetical protein
MRVNRDTVCVNELADASAPFGIDSGLVPVLDSSVRYGPTFWIRTWQLVFQISSFFQNLLFLQKNHNYI